MFLAKSKIWTLPVPYFLNSLVMYALHKDKRWFLRLRYLSNPFFRLNSVVIARGFRLKFSFLWIFSHFTNKGSLRSFLLICISIHRTCLITIHTTRKDFIWSTMEVIFIFTYLCVNSSTRLCPMSCLLIFSYFLVRRWTIIIVMLWVT